MDSGLLEDELNHRRRVIEAMGMVAHALLDERLHRTAELLEPLLDNRPVLFVRDDVIGISTEQKEGHLRSGQRPKVVNRVLGVRQGIRLGLEMVVLEELFPVAGAPLALSFAAWPALEIQHGIVGARCRPPGQGGWLPS